MNVIHRKIMKTDHAFSLNSLKAWFAGSCALVSVLALSGCNRDEIKVYTVPKEAPAATASALPEGHPNVGDMNMNAAPGMNLGMDPEARPRLTYKTPEGWAESAPNSVRVASFKINRNGQQADMSVVPLSGMAGGDAANVNRWRGQIGLDPVADDELKKAAQKIEIAGEPAELYDLSGKNPADGKPARILGAIQHRGDVAWFFKMMGDAELVEAEKSALIEFLKTVNFEAPAMAGLPPSHPPIGGMSMPGMAASDGPISHEGQPAWKVPANWKEVSGGQFLIAKFLLSGDANSEAAVNVSASAGDGGGFANNVNRWRKQLGLAEESESQINQRAKTIPVSSGQAKLIELSGTDVRSGQPAKLVGVMISQPGQTWFYKLMGDAKLVSAQQETFIQFVQSAKY
jgi:hypothetical protein